MFKIGEKVVCVDPVYNLIKNEIYEIKKIESCNCGIINIELLGVRKADSIGFFDKTICICKLKFANPNYFRHNRFRKLDYQFGHDICAELSRQYNEDFVEL